MQVQTEYAFASASVLFLYEGDAENEEDLRPHVRFIDFAHSFSGQGARDDNFLQGLTALIACLKRVSRGDEEMAEAGTRLPT
jgi:hypothetical protein